MYFETVFLFVAPSFDLTTGLVDVAHGGRGETEHEGDVSVSEFVARLSPEPKEVAREVVDAEIEEEGVDEEGVAERDGGGIDDDANTARPGVYLRPPGKEDCKL